MADFASLVVKMDSSDLKKGQTALGDVTKAAGGAERSADGAGRAFAGMGRGIAVAAASALAAAVSIAAIVGNLNRFIDATVTNEKAQAQLAAAIASTGGAAGKSVADLNKHAAALQKITTFGDEAINAMQGVLLTFTAIKGDQFDAATVAILDMSQALGKDLQSSALQVGKALNDPAKGMAALAESGIQFTDAQKAMVKSMIAANDTIGAQTVILAELDRQFGGSAVMARDTLGGALDSLRAAFGDLFELSGPGSENLRASIERLTTAVANPAFFAAVQAIGTGLFAAAEMGINALTMLLPVITAVVENIDIIGYSAGVAAAVFVGPYAVAMGAAILATFSLTGALTLLKAALIATGIGALVVGAGLLLAMFGRLVTAVGGFGNAMRLVADVGTEALQRIGFGVDFIGQSFAAMSANIQAFFLNAIRVMAGAFVDLTWVVADGLNSLFGSNLQGASAVITQELGKAQVAAEGLGASATAAANAAKDGFSAPMESIQALRDAMTQNATETESAAEATKNLNNSLGDVGGGKGGGGGSAKKAADGLSEATKEAEALRKEMEAPLVSAIDGVSNAFGDFIAGGLKDFGGFVKSILDSFKQMLSQMISMALKNKILIPIATSMGLIGGATQAVAGVAGQAASGAGGAAGLLGGAGSMLGGFGEAGSIFGFGGLGGGTGLMGGLGNALSGGLGNIFSVGANAAAAGGGILATLGAAAPIIGGIALAFSFFKSKTKELDTGLKVTVNGLDTLVQSFRTVEKSRFWGLSKKVSTTLSGAADDVSNPIIATIDGLRNSITSMAMVLGAAPDALDKFTGALDLSLKGLSDADAQQKVSEALARMGDEMVSTIYGQTVVVTEMVRAAGLSASTFRNSGGDTDGGIFMPAVFATRTISTLSDAFKAIQKSGETATQTLARLSSSIVVVNDVFQGLGFAAYDFSLSGAAAASSFADLFGSLDNFAASTAAYYDAFYTGEEKRANATSRLAASLAALGVSAIPQDRAAFRDLVDSAQLAGNSDLAAGLIMLSPAFAGLTQAVENLAAAMIVNEDRFATGVDFMRGTSRASNGIEYTPRESDAQLRAELRSLNLSMERLVSSSEITAGNTGRGADAADDTLAFTLEQTL